LSAQAKQLLASRAGLERRRHVFEGASLKNGRAGAQANFCRNKNLAEGETPAGRTRKKAPTGVFFLSAQAKQLLASRAGLTPSLRCGV